MHAGLTAIIASAAVLLIQGNIDVVGNADERLWHPDIEETSCQLQGTKGLALLQTGTLRTASSTVHLSQGSGAASPTTAVRSMPTIQPPQDLSHSEQLMINIREGCKSYAKSGCGSAVRFELFRIAVASLSVLLDCILVAGLFCQVQHHVPFAEADKTSWALNIHITVGIMEAVLLVATFFFPGEQRPPLLRGLLALEIAFASTVSAVTTDLRSSNDRESRCVGTAYLLLASAKLVLAALLLASPAAIDLLWAYFFAHHICPWVRAFMGIFQLVGVFKGHQSAVASVAAVLLVLPCGPSFCRGGAILALVVIFLLFSFGAASTKQTTEPWFKHSQEHGEAESIMSAGQDESAASDAEALLEAEVVIKEAQAEAAMANYHREMTVASMYHSSQGILEDELKVEKRNCTRAEVALAQLSAEHMRLVSVREELEVEKNVAQEARQALAERTQQPDVLEQAVLRLQSKLHDAEAARETLTAQLGVSQGNCMTAADEVKHLKAALANYSAEEARIEYLKDQALEELAVARKMRTAEVWEQDADDALKVALLSSEATAARALQEYTEATSKALQHETESTYVRNLLTSVEAEVMSCQVSMTEIKEEEAIAAQEKQRLIAVEADLRRRQQFRPITVSTAAQVGSGSIFVQQAEELQISHQRSLRQSEELRASERHNLRQAEELRVTERAAASVYAEWQSAETHLAASQGVMNGLEAQREALRSEMASRLLQTSDEQEQIRRLRQQVQTLEEELDSREARLIRVEPLVVSKEQSRIDPRIASASSSPTRSHPRIASVSSSPTKSRLQPAPSPSGQFTTMPNLQTESQQPRSQSQSKVGPSSPTKSHLHPVAPSTSGPFATMPNLQTESQQPRSQSPYKVGKRMVDESSLQPTRSASPMDAPRTQQRPVQWLPPGRAQSILASSSLSMPGSSSSMSSLPPVLQTGEATLHRPGSATSMPKSMPAVLPKGAPPVSSTSRIQRPRSMQS